MGCGNSVIMENKTCQPSVVAESDFWNHQRYQQWYLPSQPSGIPIRSLELVYNTCTFPIQSNHSCSVLMYCWWFGNPQTTTWDVAKTLFTEWDFNYLFLNWWVYWIFSLPSTVSLPWIPTELAQLPCSHNCPQGTRKCRPHRNSAWSI